MVRFNNSAMAASASVVLALIMSLSSLPAAMAKPRVRGQTQSAIHKRRQLQKNNMNNDNNMTNGNNATPQNAVPQFQANTLSQVYINSVVVTNGGNAGGDADGNAGVDPNNNANNNNNNNILTPPTETSPNAVCADVPAEYVDVIIIGAGMAGIQAAATLQAQDPTLTYVLLESTDRVGGRVRSVDFGGVKIEDGANWILDFQDNPMWAMAQNAGDFKMTLHDWSDATTYDENVRIMPFKLFIYLPACEFPCLFQDE